jgi:hypothetical protein
MTQELAVAFFPLVRPGTQLVVCKTTELLRHEQVQFFPYGSEQCFWGFVNVLCHSNILISSQRNTLSEAANDEEDDNETNNGIDI